MVETKDPVVAKDRMFKMRLDATDRERLEVVAEFYGVPVATVIRIVVKKEYDAIRRKAASSEPPARKPTTKPRKSAR